jgi:hypothetical protein
MLLVCLAKLYTIENPSCSQERSNKCKDLDGLRSNVGSGHQEPRLLLHQVQLCLQAAGVQRISSEILLNVVSYRFDDNIVIARFF